jgi:hypothetical protein
MTEDVDMTSNLRTAGTLLMIGYFFQRSAQRRQRRLSLRMQRAPILVGLRELARMKGGCFGLATAEPAQICGALKESPTGQMRRPFAYHQCSDEGPLRGRIFVHQFFQHGRELVDRVRRLQLQLGCQSLIGNCRSSRGDAQQASSHRSGFLVV